MNSSWPHNRSQDSDLWLGIDLQDQWEQLDEQFHDLHQLASAYSILQIVPEQQIERRRVA